LQRELGWSPENCFEEGLLKTVQWYIDYEPWQRAILERGYTGRRLGLSQLPV
jgi:dTDP-glucose 4,6-dehydratase